MSIILDVFKMLFKMFVADRRLTLSILASVAIVAYLLKGMGISPMLGGMLLLLLCLVVLIETILREAKLRARK